MGEITVSVVGSNNPNWFDTHQIPKNAAYAIPDEAATRLMTASLDVTDPTAATRVVSDAVDHFGRIDVLVNNAGYGLITAFEEMSPEQIHQQFATNVYGVMNVTRAVLPVMRRQRSGHLFTIASMGGYLGGSRGTAYAASKFAVAGFTESLALELEEFGITATIVGPGYFRTDSRQVLGDSRTGDAHRGLSRVKCCVSRRHGDRQPCPTRRSERSRPPAC